MAGVPGVLRPDELAAIRATIAAFLPDLATLYASDGTTVVLGGMRVRLVNDRSLTSMRNASDFYTLTAAAGTPLAPGQVVRHGDDWYLVAKTSVDTAHTVEEQAILLALPYQATVSRESAAQKATGRSVWGSPLGTTPSESDGTVAGTATSHTIRVGYGNAFDPLDQQVVGPLPKTGNVTAYTPLGSIVRTGDSIGLPDGRPARIDRTSTLYSEGSPYAIQLLLDMSSGSGLTSGTPT